MPQRPAPMPAKPDFSAAPAVAMGQKLVIFGFLGLMLALAFARLSGAVVVPGQVVVESEVKKIQHLYGGIVAQIAVKNGDLVQKGDTLLRLDDTIARTTLAQLNAQMAQMVARKARLEAERDGAATIALPPNFTALYPEGAHLAQTELRMFTEAHKDRLQTISQLNERIGQLENEIAGQTAQAAAKQRESGYIGTELKSVETLYAQQLTPLARLSALQRESARLEGERGALIAGMAKVRGQIAETRIQIAAIDQKTRSDAVKELREVEASLSQLVEKRVAAEDTLSRVDIRAPQAGRVHEMVSHTLGGVIEPGKVIMVIVPVNEQLAVELRVASHEIDQIRVGQPVVMRFSAFNQRTTPELNGHLTRVGADASRDPATGASFYVGRAVLEPGELERLSGLALVPGMPVEAFVVTQPRSALSYLVKPLFDSFNRGMRER